MLGEALRDFKAALSLLTRLPGAAGPDRTGRALADSVVMFPAVGALVGALGALVFGGAHGLGLPGWPAAVLALGARIWLTGALHEDGLGDVADGFGGGTTRARKLEIMRDSRIGSFGAIAIGLAVLARVSAIAALATPGTVALVLIAAGAASRAALPPVMLLLPKARADGLAASAGRPHVARVVASAMLGVLLVALLLPPGVAGAALLGASLAAVLLGALAQRQIGGHTGDVLGAVQQVAEIGFLFGALALLPR
ncbi:MAG: adenosylcobinamide-GDP ribazoletransferase [Geminicoccaceae bacterium]